MNGEQPIGAALGMARAAKSRERQARSAGLLPSRALQMDREAKASRKRKQAPNSGERRGEGRGEKRREGRGEGRGEGGFKARKVAPEQRAELNRRKRGGRSVKQFKSKKKYKRR